MFSPSASRIDTHMYVNFEYQDVDPFLSSQVRIPGFVSPGNPSSILVIIDLEEVSVRFGMDEPTKVL